MKASYCRTGSLHLKLTLLAAPLLLVGAAGCFGQGVSPDAGGDKAEWLSVSDVTLVPPAPAAKALVWTNVSTLPLRIDRIAISEAAQVQWDTRQCPNYPNVAPSSSCSLAAVAQPSATPGDYPVTVHYRIDAQARAAAFTLTIRPGQLRINDGAAIALDATTSAVPVNVLNEGFDLAQLNLSVQCPDASAPGQSCSLQIQDCANGLAANASCTALLVTTNVPIGSGGLVTAGGAGTNASSCSARISVGSLAVQNLSVNTPGTYLVQLTNTGNAPLSVKQASVGGANVHGMYFSGASSGALAPCQRFDAACTLPLVVTADAAAPNGVATLNVSYTDGDAAHVASGTLFLQNATSVAVNPLHASLPSSTGSLPVAATNLGPFTWHDAGLGFGPAFNGVNITSTCGTEISPGDQYTAVAHTTLAAAEGSASTLRATGSNLAAPASTPIAVGHSLLVLGTDAAATGNAFLATSYDNAATWVPRPQGLVDAVWKASVMDHDTWTVVGRQTQYQTTYTTHDRGATWLSSTMPQGVGTLRGVASVPGLYVAVGDHSEDDTTPDSIFFRSSTDDGLTWSYESNFFGPPGKIGAARAISTNAIAWVAVGSDMSNYFLARSLTGTSGWVATPGSSGKLYAVAYDGRGWLAVGSDASGNQLYLYNSAADATPSNWVQIGPSTPAPGTLRGVASNGTQWVVVGDDGTNRIASVGTSAATPTFSAPVVLGPGTAYGVAVHENAWKVSGLDSSTGRGVIDSSLDAATWTSDAMPAAAALFGINARN